MTIGGLHRFALTGTASLACLGVVSGSPLLAVVGLLIVLSILLRAKFIYSEKRSLIEQGVVHGLTVLGLAYAALIFREVRIDSVLIVLMLGLANRFLLRGGQRDDFLIVGTAAVLIAASTTVTPGIEFVLLVLCFVPCLIWSLWTSALLGMAEIAEREATAQRGTFKTELRQRRLPPWIFRLAGAGLGLGLIGSLTVSFLPRYRFSQMLSPGAFASLPGASNSMRLESGGVENRESSAVVLRVRPSNGDIGLVGGLYARLYALDVFDGVTWTAASEGHFEFAARPGGDADAPYLEVLQERLLRGGQHHPVAAIGRSFPLEPELRELHQDLSGTWVVDRFASRVLSYRAVLDRRSPDVRLPTRYRESSEALERRVPALDPRIVELGRSLTEGKTPEQQVRSVLLHLGRGFSYTLDPLEGESADPLSRFLFEAKQGHCELYAGAAAVLLRIGGLRTRVATGYYEGSWNVFGDFQTFTENDAHAWTEVYLPGEGWRWIDATPEDMRRRSDAGAFWLTLRDGYDALSALWYDKVVDFDGARQRAFYEALSREIEAALRDLPGLEDASQTEPGKARAAATGVLLGLLAPALLAFGWWETRRRRRLSYWGQRLRRALVRAAHGVPSGENLPLPRLLGLLPAELYAEAEPVVRGYESERFGPPSGNPTAVSGRVRALERAIRARGLPRPPAGG